MSQRAMRYAEAAFAPLETGNPDAPKSRAKPVQHEQLIQGAVAALLDVYQRQGKLRWAPVPSGTILQGTREERARRGRILRDRGMLRPGIADIVLCLAPVARFGAIELKAPGNNPTPDQVDFIAGVLRLGGYGAVCRSVDEVKAVVDGWIKAEAAADLRRLAADAKARSEAV